MIHELKPIGFWCKPDHHDPAVDVGNKILNAFVGFITKTKSLPHPREHVDRSWDSGEREMVRKYLANGEVHRAYFGSARCRMCSDSIDGNGSRDFTDGVWLWPEGYAHYLECHWVKPPQEFVDHVKRRVAQQQQNPRR